MARVLKHRFKALGCGFNAVGERGASAATGCFFEVCQLFHKEAPPPPVAWAPVPVRMHMPMALALSATPAPRPVPIYPIAYCSQLPSSWPTGARAFMRGSAVVPSV